MTAAHDSAIPRNPSGASRLPKGPRRRLVNGMQWWVPWAFVGPSLLFLAAFLLIPLIAGLLVSFTDWDVISGIEGIRWVGLDNFVTLFWDRKFWEALGRTAIYAGVGVPLTILGGLALAMVLNRPLIGRAALRAIFFLPAIVNIIALGSVWLLLLNPRSGLINEGLRLLGVSDGPGWISSSQWAMPALILMAVWGGVGYISVLYLAALQDMPTDLYEAATLDGAGWWQKFRVITWPALMPTTVFLTVTQMIGQSQTFGVIAYMTGGGPGEATTVLSYYMYKNGFEFYRFGYAAAIGVVSLLLVLVLTMLLWHLQRGKSLYGDDPDA